MIEVLSTKNTRIMWSISIVGVCLLLFWFVCAYFMGRAETRKAMLFSSLVVMIICIFAAVAMDKNMKRIKELSEDR
ncbi:MAG TPA: hypothetical protein VF627_00285, partial [Abditibacterium sp.]